MNILLLGYGKMGRAIEQTALERGHTIVARIDADNRADLDALPDTAVHVVIEFSTPEAVAANLRYAIGRGWPVVCGTTGWLAQRPAIDALVTERQGAFFYASNYSIGVNLFFRLNKTLARFMHRHPAYRVSMTEIHHTEKKDAPSGTALTLAEGIGRQDVPIESVREGAVPGTHIVRYESVADQIEISHVAHSRTGFALGAVTAAEWLRGRQGIFGMDDLLDD
jgi:4-hydroxy-tetrahydrodipicolinate reductase